MTQAVGGTPPLTHPDVSDFAPGLLSIQESPPARLPRTVLLLVVALFGTLVLWSSFATLDIIASAEGRLVPQTYVKIVQPADAGIIHQLLVREGDSVRDGQVLVRMDANVAEADIQALQNEIALKNLQLRRIDAELAGNPLTLARGEPLRLFGQVEAQHRAHEAAYRDALLQEKENLNKARHDLGAAEQMLRKLEQALPVYRKSAESYGKLAAEGFFSPLAAEEKVRDRMEKERELDAQSATVAGLRSAILAAERRVAQVTSAYRSQLQNERIDVASSLHKLQQDHAKVAHKRSLLELRAPQAGIIKDLATHTVGTVVQPGTVLMSLVPDHEPLHAEVYVRNEDAGFMYVDQKAQVKVFAYPFQKYGLIEGTVVQVGADAVDPDNSQKAKGGSQAASAPTYKGIVRLSQQTLDSQGQSLKLAPGMQVVAELHQGRRTVMEYLLSPVRKAFHEAARER
jgi:HlyD family secretion protein